VNNSYYTSGFIYSPKTNQILLLKDKKENGDLLWTTFTGNPCKEEDTILAFQKFISKLLGVNIKAKDIYSVYDYFVDEKNIHHYVFYAEVSSPRKLKHLKDECFCWVSFEETPKLKFQGRTKQDIIVGQRVINAKWRDDEASKQAVMGGEA